MTPLKNTIDYLSRLLNKPISEGMELALSSAQKSRLHGWLIQNNIAFEESVLSNKFSAEQLICGTGVVNPRELKVVDPSYLNNSNEVCDFEVGIDMQRVDELFPHGLPIDPKLDQSLVEMFTLKELSYAQSKTDPEITLTGIFCAKEAIQKASSLRLGLKEIEVLPDEEGRPIYEGFKISISHSKNYAIAMAVKTIRNQSLIQSVQFSEGANCTSSIASPKIKTQFRWMDVGFLLTLIWLLYQISGRSFF